MLTLVTSTNHYSTKNIHALRVNNECFTLTCLDKLVQGEARWRRPFPEFLVNFFRQTFGHPVVVLGKVGEILSGFEIVVCR